MLADLIPHILATKMPVRRQEQQPLPAPERKAKYRQHNEKRDLWRAARRAKGLPVT